MGKDIKVGDIVRSKVNSIYRGTYTVTKTNKTTCWVVPNEHYLIMKDGTKKEMEQPTYKNNRYSTMEKVG